MIYSNSLSHTLLLLANYVNYLSISFISSALLLTSLITFLRYLKHINLSSMCGCIFFFKLVDLLYNLSVYPWLGIITQAKFYGSSNWFTDWKWLETSGFLKQWEKNIPSNFLNKATWFTGGRAVMWSTLNGLKHMQKNTFIYIWDWNSAWGSAAIRVRLYYKSVPGVDCWQTVTWHGTADKPLQNKITSL